MIENWLQCEYTSPSGCFSAISIYGSHHVIARAIPCNEDKLLLGSILNDSEKATKSLYEQHIIAQLTAHEME